MNQRLAALDFITGCLGVRSDPDADGILRSTVISGRLDWQLVLGIANIQKIAPTLWVALRNRKLVECLPAEIRERFFKIYVLNVLRNKDFAGQVIEVVRQLNSIGIEPILLKGSVSLFLKTFDDFGSRAMADIDILVPKKSAEECWNALHTLGYLPIEANPFFYVDYQEHHHLQPLYRLGKCGTVEIHRDALPNSAARILPTSLIWQQSERIANQLGLMMRSPSPTHRLLLNLLHSDLINKTCARGKISLRSLYELATMQVIYRERIDWEIIRKLMTYGGQAPTLSASLYLAQRLLGNPIAERTRPTSGAVFHYARTRLQARWKWLDELVERAFWFSEENICGRYCCDNSFWSIFKGRFRLMTYLSWKYTNLALRCIERKISIDRAQINR